MELDGARSGNHVNSSITHDSRYVANVGGVAQAIIHEVGVADGDRDGVGSDAQGTLYEGLDIVVARHIVSAMGKGIARDFIGNACGVVVGDLAGG